MEQEEDKKISNFIRDIIASDVETGKHDTIITRFPPEPNGYLHIGHAKAICISYGLAEEFKGEYHLRFDDTNPVKEEQEYVDAIKEDVYWLGFDWGSHEYYASDYFEKMYQFALLLIEKGLAYVDDQTPDEMRKGRGTLTESGTESPFRNRSVTENTELFIQMKEGAFLDGSRVLRAKIDMSSPNLNMRDPVMYRILHAEHPRHGSTWNIYPMYDWAHGIEDSLEDITHSLCSLEFEDHRPLYNWFLQQLDGVHQPRQIEFARLELTFTVMSKRLLKQMVDEKLVAGWDDPRMPTLSGLRRRGYTPDAIKSFMEKIRVSKSNSTVDVALLEYCQREELNRTSNRRMVVLNPLKVIITNYQEKSVEEFDGENNPEDEQSGTHKVPFSREIYVEREDYLEDAPRKFFRLSIGREVRLKFAFYITCNDAIKDAAGNITELHCTYDPASKGGWTDDGRRVKGTLHWVSCAHAVPVEVRKYDRLFTCENPLATSDGKDFKENINPNSLEVLNNCMAEPILQESQPGERMQFLRHGYYCVDSDSTKDAPIFNLTVGLRDSWARSQKK